MAVALEEKGIGVQPSLAPQCGRQPYHVHQLHHHSFMEIARRCGPTIFQLTAYATKVRGITAMCDIIDTMDSVAGDLTTTCARWHSALSPTS